MPNFFNEGLETLNKQLLKLRAIDGRPWSYTFKTHPIDRDIYILEVGVRAKYNFWEWAEVSSKWRMTSQDFDQHIRLALQKLPHSIKRNLPKTALSILGGVYRFAF